MDQFVLTVLEVLDVDSKESSHSLSYDCNSPEEILNKFDDIAYSKGGSVIRMLSYFLSNETFTEGIKVNFLLTNLPKTQIK